MNRSEAGRLGSFASLKAQQANAAARREAYARNPVSCKKCLSPIPFEKRRSRFCNHSCAASFINSKREKVLIQCSSCDAIFPRQGGRRNCDKCKSNGSTTKFENLKSDRIRKKRLIKERGHKCEECGLAEWLGRSINLTMDHVNGNPDDSCRDNLKLLCWNCHSMTSTFGSRNAGKFPNSKRKVLRSKY